MGKFRGVYILEGEEGVERKRKRVEQMRMIMNGLLQVEEGEDEGDINHQRTIGSERKEICR